MSASESKVSPPGSKEYELHRPECAEFIWVLLNVMALPDLARNVSGRLGTVNGKADRAAILDALTKLTKHPIYLEGRFEIYSNQMALERLREHCTPLIRALRTVPKQALSCHLSLRHLRPLRSASFILGDNFINAVKLRSRNRRLQERFRAKAKQIEGYGTVSGQAGRSDAASETQVADCLRLEDEAGHEVSWEGIKVDGPLRRIVRNHHRVDLPPVLFATFLALWRKRPEPVQLPVDGSVAQDPKCTIYALKKRLASKFSDLAKAIQSHGEKHYVLRHKSED